MEFLINGLCFVAGVLLSYILFARSGYMGRFEKMIWAGLREGKRVIVSLDSGEAYIFELFGNRLRVSAGVVEMMEELPHGNALDVSGADQSVSVDETSVSESEIQSGG